MLPVTSSSGCALGETLVLEGETPNEEIVIVGFGSLVIQSPTLHGHAAGTPIVEGTAAAPVAPIAPGVPTATPPATPPPEVPLPVDDSGMPRKESDEQRQQHQQLFEATDVTVKRQGHRVR
jgi:hypothetical protein